MFGVAGFALVPAESPPHEMWPPNFGGFRAHMCRLTYKPRASLCADRLVLARVSAIFFFFLDCVFNPYEYLVTFVLIMSTVPSTYPDGLCPGYVVMFVFAVSLALLA